jgi:hypothetical protein
VTFDAGGPNQTVVTADIGAACFVARFDADAELEWVRDADMQESNAELAGLAATSDGAVVAWNADGPVSLEGSVIDGRLGTVIVRYNADGTLAGTIRGDAIDDGTLRSFSIAARPDGSVLVGGWFVGPVDLGNGFLLGAEDGGFVASYP